MTPKPFCQTFRKRHQQQAMLYLVLKSSHDDGEKTKPKQNMTYTRSTNIKTKVRTVPMRFREEPRNPSQPAVHFIIIFFHPGELPPPQCDQTKKRGSKESASNHCSEIRWVPILALRDPAHLASPRSAPPWCVSVMSRPVKQPCHDPETGAAWDVGVRGCWYGVDQGFRNCRL